MIFVPVFIYVFHLSAGPRVSWTVDILQAASRLCECLPLQPVHQSLHHCLWWSREERSVHHVCRTGLWACGKCAFSVQQIMFVFIVLITKISVWRSLASLFRRAWIFFSQRTLVRTITFKFSRPCKVWCPLLSSVSSSIRNDLYALQFPGGPLAVLSYFWHRESIDSPEAGPVQLRSDWTLLMERHKMVKGLSEIKMKS